MTEYDVQLFYSNLTSVHADSLEKAVELARAKAPSLTDDLDYDCADVWTVREDGQLEDPEPETVEERDWYKIHLLIYGAFCSTFNMTDDLGGLRSFGDFMTDIYLDTEYMVYLLTEGAKTMDMDWSELFGLYLMDPIFKEAE